MDKTGTLHTTEDTTEEEALARVRRYFSPDTPAHEILNSSALSRAAFETTEPCTHLGINLKANWKKGHEKAWGTPEYKAKRLAKFRRLYEELSRDNPHWGQQAIYEEIAERCPKKDGYPPNWRTVQRTLAKAGLDG